MATIEIKVTDSNTDSFKFRVEVTENDSKTVHKVEMNRLDYDNLSDGKISPEEFIKRSFEFLLEREPKESILSSFNISVISRYFPEYPEQIASYY